MSEETYKYFRITGKTHQNGRTLAGYLGVDIKDVIDYALALVAKERGIQLPYGADNGVPPMVVKEDGAQ